MSPSVQYMFVWYAIWNLQQIFNMALGKKCCFSLEGPILNNVVIRKSSKENNGREFVPSLQKQPKCKSVQLSLLLLKKMDCHGHNSFLPFCRMLRGLSPVLEAISPVTSSPWKASFIELVAIAKRFFIWIFFIHPYLFFHLKFQI